MSEKCQHHGEDESPWMCECTRQRLRELEAKQSDNANMVLVEDSRHEYLLTMEQRCKELVAAFAHRHRNNGVNDACKDCGFDLRDPLHAPVNSAAR